MDLPIMGKPTFLNISIDFENFVFSDFLINDSFNIKFVQSIFGPNLDWDWINNINIDFEAQNHWIRRPRTFKTYTASVVYDHLVSGDKNPWSGWDHIWKLCVLPRPKFSFGSWLMGSFLLVPTSMI